MPFSRGRQLPNYCPTAASSSRAALSARTSTPTWRWTPLIQGVDDAEARALLLSPGPLASLAETQRELQRRLIELTPTSSPDLHCAWKEALEHAAKQPPEKAVTSIPEHGAGSPVRIGVLGPALADRELILWQVYEWFSIHHVLPVAQRPVEVRLKVRFAIRDENAEQARGLLQIFHC